MKTNVLGVLVFALFLLDSVRVLSQGMTREAQIQEYECQLAEATDSARIRPYIVLVDAYTRTEPEKAEAYLAEAWDLIRKHPTDERYYQYYGLLGNLQLVKGSYEDGVKYMKQSLVYLHRTHDLEMLSHMYNNLGSITKWLDKLDEAHIYLDSALAIKGRLNDTAGMAITQVNLGNLFQLESKYEQAIEQYFGALRFQQRQKEENIRVIATTYINIAACYSALKEYRKSLEMNFKAFDLVKGKNMLVEQAAAYTNIVSQYINLQKPDSARYYNDQARDVVVLAEDQEAMADYYYNEGTILHLEGKWNDALTNLRLARDFFTEIGNVPKQAETGISEAECLGRLGRAGEGLSCVKEVYAMIGESDLHAVRLRALHLLYELSKEVGRVRDALVYHELYQELHDVVYTNEKNKIIQEIETRYNVEKAELLAAQREAEVVQAEEKNRALTKQNEFQRMRNILLFVAVVLLILVIALIVSVQKMRAKSHRQEKKMMETQREMAEMELENERLQREQLNTQVHSQYRSLQDMANHIVEKNELIKHVNDSVRKVKGHVEQVTAKEKLTDLEIKIRNSLNIERDRTQLNRQIVELNSKFAHDLKMLHPDLSDREIRLSALLRLGLSSKEIAGLFNISSTSVDQSRYRLRKKLGLQADSNLVDYLLSL